MNNTDKADQLTNIYLKMRDSIKELEEQIKSIKVEQDKVASKLDSYFGEKGESLKLQSGTVSRRVQTTFQISNWDEMHNFIKDNDAMHLLEKRVHGTNMKEFLEANPDVVPPSLQVVRKNIISVRKPSNR